VFDLNHGALALGLIAGLAFVTWLASLWRRDASIVDGMWPVFIGGAGLLYCSLAPQLGRAAIAALVLLAIWATRLGVHITARNHGQPEDRRYQKIRANNPPFWIKSLYVVFGFQALLAWIVALPFMAITSRNDGFELLVVPGMLLALFGVGFETVADSQLERFKRDPANHGHVLDTGLWRHSRHPNYFGECCVWWGFGLVGLGTGAWWSLASPVLMTVLLLKVSGVTLLERDIGERWPDYACYVRETSAFFPAPRRVRAPAA
jgi:steroid 5-alpha reductase family enzyme